MSEKKPVLLITGVCGRIGHAAATIFSREFQVIGFDVISPEKKVPGVDYYQVDLSSLDNVKQVLEKVKEEYGSNIVSCIHLAAYYSFEGGAWEKYQSITIDGTENLLEGLHSFSLEQFIFSSTLLVYAPTKPGQKITENSALNPKWNYPLSKVKTEELLKNRREEGKTVIFRIAGVYDDECNSIPISHQIDRIYHKELESHLFPGNPEHGATFLHMDDLIAALKLVVEKRSNLDAYEVFVLGEPDLMSYKELQDELGLLLHGKKWWTLRIPKWVAKMGAALKSALPFFKKSFIQPWMVDLADDHYEVDIAKAQEILGWDPVHKVKNCLPLMVEDLNNNPNKWAKKHGIAP